MENFITKNINQTHGYINKRRLSLLKDENDKEYAKKKLNFGENFVVKRTVPKEFHFNKSKSRKSKLNNNDHKFYQIPNSISFLNTFHIMQ